MRSLCLHLSHRDPSSVVVWAGGMACDRRYGAVVETIESERLTVRRLPWLDAEDDDAIAQSAAATRAVGDAIDADRPDALVLLGDRFETLAAALAATVRRVPIVHLHGGEETEGAIDNAMRHAITKLAHLHLVAHDEYRARVVRMGEDPGAVHVVGAPGLDNLWRGDVASREEIESFLGCPLKAPVVLVTVHPATLAKSETADIAAVVGAMDDVDATYVVTLPNSDPGHAPVRAGLLEACRARPSRAAVEALGERRYWGLMRIADAMLGNSSSAIIEAPALALPAVDVGERQRGRVRGANVIHAPAEREAVAAALRTALGPGFRAEAARKPGPFGDGRSGERIARILSDWSPPSPPAKRFHVAK